MCRRAQTPLPAIDDSEAPRVQPMRILLLLGLVLSVVGIAVMMAPAELLAELGVAPVRDAALAMNQYGKPAMPREPERPERIVQAAPSPALVIDAGAQSEPGAVEPSAQQRPTAAEAELAARRLAEEQEQDRRRHAAVQAQLQSREEAAARRNVVITMYSTTWCGVCTRARAYMQEQRIPFTDYDIEQDAAAKAKARQLNPRGSVPTITIDDQVLIGFSAPSLERDIQQAARKRAGG